MNTQQLAARTRPTWTVGDRLRKARENIGLDQAHFAGRSGISRNTINNYEKGHTAPNPIYLERWADVCGVDLDWIVQGEDEVLPRLDSNQQPIGLWFELARSSRADHVWPNASAMIVSNPHYQRHEYHGRASG